ncbi:MAG: hypothetical protein FWH02_07340, partial [Oscillospiraceae bacterium]|nr:hypothetical protein [Oscillospiraceae bacterium]
MKPGVRESFNRALKKLPLRRRFMVTVAAYTGVIILLWAGCYSIAYRAVSRGAAENAALASGDLIGRISAEFSQMRTIASVIASSSYVQDFLSERDVAAYYEKAGIVSEIIQKAAFPITSSDSIIAFNEGGDFFRFSGGLSNASSAEIYQNFRGAGAFYTIIELDGTLFFCHSAPVFDTSGRTPVRIGSIAILTGLDKTRRMLEHDGIDMALILGGEVVLSNNRSLEGIRADGLAPRYGMVSVAAIAGTPLTVAAAIPKAAVFPGSRLFIFMGLIALFLLLTGIAGLYHFLSGYMIRPMADIIAGVRQIQNLGRLADTGIADFDTLVGD